MEFEDLPPDARRRVQDLGHELSKVPMTYAAPVYFASPPRPGKPGLSDINNGTGSLVAIDKKQFCITNFHADTTPRTKTAAVQITRLSPTFPRHPCRHIQRIHPSTSSAAPTAFQGASRRFIPHLGRGIRHRMTPVARYIPATERRQRDKAALISVSVGNGVRCLPARMTWWISSSPL